MRVAVTGTPGTGKSTVCKILSRQGHTVVDLSELANERGLVEPPKKNGGPGLVDVKGVAKLGLPDDELVFVYSHFAHMAAVDIVIVLRCSPKVLRSRLRKRKWSENKIRENLEVEAIDLITAEAVEIHENVYEVDTTNDDAGQSARQIIEIVKGGVKGHEPGRIDWSKEILEWY